MATAGVPGDKIEAAAEIVLSLPSISLDALLKVLGDVGVSAVLKAKVRRALVPPGSTYAA
jgi:hypothetical protein